MRWGIELWDRFDDVSTYVHKGIEFCEKYEDFCKKRCTIENNYAKHLRKLIEAFEPKKKDNEENNASHVKCFVRMLNELKDIAGQHELVAENMEDRVIQKINLLIRSLKDERRKCIEDKERFHTELLYTEELLEKSKLKYERAFKDLEKAKELYYKIDNDDHASKSDIKKQKNVCDQRQSTLNSCEAEYGKQLCEANKVKSLYYREQLPNVLDTLQNVDVKRIENFKSFVCECVNVDVEVLPRISKCHKETDNSAQQISPLQDTEIAITLFKTGYSIPGDYVFEDLNEKYSNGLNNNSNNTTLLHQSTNGSLNSTNTNGTSHHTLTSSSSSSYTTRQKKYRTINRIKGLFATSGKNENDLYSLPPQQLKKELLKKIDTLQADIIKQQKEREGILKLKDIYSKNQKLGDAQATTQALDSNEEKLNNLMNQLKNYQEIYNDVELNGAYKHPNSGNQSSEYSSNGGGAGSGSSIGGGTLPRDKSAATTQQNNHIYQSPSQHSVNSGNNSSLPGTPVSHHSNFVGNNETPVKSNYSTGAYAVSPVSQLSGTNNNNGNKMAPIVNHNESFDDDDDVEQYDDGCYENPSAALRANLQKAATTTVVGMTTTKVIKNESDGSTVKTTTGKYVTSAAGIIYADSQYDRVDSLQHQNGNGNGNHANGSTNGNGTQQSNQTDADNDIIIGTALVMYAFSGNVQNAMSIQENESLNVLERDSGDGWTLVKRLNGEKGYVPTDYIRIVYY